MRYSRLVTIILFVSLFFPYGIVSAASAGLYFSSLPKIMEEGEVVTVSVRVKDTDESINAISGVVSFSESLLQAVSVSKEKSLINLWTQEPKISRGKISFEGVILNPGFKGTNGLVFQVTFKAKNTGQVYLNFTEGAVLANDGLGTNVLTLLSTGNFRIVGATLKPNTPVMQPPLVVVPEQKKIARLPVITDYPLSIHTKEKMRLEGKGEPNALTKIVFQDVSIKSIGEKFMEFVQTKKKRLDSVLVQNDELGNFQYISPSDLLAGVYNATPFLVEEDSNVEKPGFGVQLFVSDSKIVRYLIIAINVLGLLIPIVTLCVIIYFIPWYSWRKMRVLRKKLGLEEEKIELTGIDLARQSRVFEEKQNQEKKFDEQKKW